MMKIGSLHYDKIKGEGFVKWSNWLDLETADVCELDTLKDISWDVDTKYLLLHKKLFPKPYYPSPVDAQLMLHRICKLADAIARDPVAMCNAERAKQIEQLADELIWRRDE